MIGRDENPALFMLGKGADTITLPRSTPNLYNENVIHEGNRREPQFPK